MELPVINLADYQYPLPEDRIAQHPLSNRDESRLLVYQAGSIGHHHFKELSNYLPKHATLVFNDTKVIPARLLFQKDTGAFIEIFLLNPIEPTTDINLAMQERAGCTWTCMIGNLRRWKEGQTLFLNLQVDKKKVVLTASRAGTDQVTFSWGSKDLTFVEIVKSAGQVPLPPYMKRKAESEDRKRYQTVYSKSHGAVAAPTAGLHFTDSLLKILEFQGVKKEFITLHVGAGTFLPIKTGNVTDHAMHGEQVYITSKNIDHLIKSDNLIAVGTTSLRTLESLYWYGVKLINGLGQTFSIGKLFPYQDHPTRPGFKEALKAVQQQMKSKHLTSIKGHTEIFIFPPYQIKSSIGLITNFHLPSSTLILLVAAFIGDDWRKVYQSALDNNYRFLSYGDSSLLLPGIRD
jgi:S-adenosylmethionine:tRNA ribosyltransferase-isomerase